MAAKDFVRQTLDMPTPVALGFLRAWHDDTCRCGDLDAHGGPEALLRNMRQLWAGRS